MLVRYRTNSSLTAQQMKDDIVGLIDGTIATVNDLSNGCNKAATTIIGTYPSGIYVKVNGTSNTFSKEHHQDQSIVHYFRLTFSGTRMTTFTFARSYTAETDTLINSRSETVNIDAVVYSAGDQYPLGIDIVITDKGISFLTTANTNSFGFFDTGENGITSAYVDHIRMVYLNLRDGNFRFSYGYNLLGPNFSGYGLISGNIVNLTLPLLKDDETGSAVVVENPVFVSSINQGYTAHGVYGISKLGLNLMAGGTVYNTSSTARIASYDYSILTG